MAAEGKVTPELIDELQRSGRTVFLRMAGYTPRDIAGFGDLVKLPEEKMQELLRNKTELEIAYLLGEGMENHPPQIEKLHGKKRKKSR